MIYHNINIITRHAHLKEPRDLSPNLRGVKDTTRFDVVCQMNVMRTGRALLPERRDRVRSVQAAGEQWLMTRAHGASRRTGGRGGGRAPTADARAMEAIAPRRRGGRGLIIRA